MVLGEVFSRFATESPVSVMVRGLMEHVLSPEKINAVFARTARVQYERELLFSTVVDLMSHVVCGIHPSVHAAYQAEKEEIAVSITALYDKLNGTEPEVSRALVQQTATELAEVVREMGGTRTPRLEGSRIKILDGTALAASEHRLEELRETAAGPLPGKCLVVLEPTLGLVTEVFPCEDGHAQERALLGEVLKTVDEGDLWIADRNFCTAGFLAALGAKRADFVIRRHGKLRCDEVSEPRASGRASSGRVWEQAVRVGGASGAEVRQITVRLAKKTRDGDREIRILTTLPAEVADAATVADLYRGRWRIEGAFQEMAETLSAEIQTLGYPKAALLGFCVGLVSYNVFATLKAALRSVQGEEKIEREVSAYYLTDELAGTYRGMRIAIPDAEWEIFRRIGPAQLAALLREMAGQVKLARFRKHPRGPKKPRPPRRSNKKEPHVSTAKLLAARQRRS